MAATIVSVKTALGNNDLSDSVVTQYLDDAAIFLEKYGVESTNPRYDLLQRLYTCHLLYKNGLHRITVSESVGDVSASYIDNTQSQEQSDSNFLEMFFIILGRNRYISSP